jgi:hypothetical protein
MSQRIGPRPPSRRRARFRAHQGAPDRHRPGRRAPPSREECVEVSERDQLTAELVLFCLLRCKESLEKRQSRTTDGRQLTVAQSLEAIEVMSSGWPGRRIPCLATGVDDGAAVLEGADREPVARRFRHTFSTGLQGGNTMRDILWAITRLSPPCQPARSRTSTGMSAGRTVRAISARGALSANGVSPAATPEGRRLQHRGRTRRSAT